MWLFHNLPAKGKQVDIPAHGCGGGDARRDGEVGGSTGQRFLFCLTVLLCCVESVFREKHARPGKASNFISASSSFSTNLEKPLSGAELDIDVLFVSVALLV